MQRGIWTLLCKGLVAVAPLLLFVVVTATNLFGQISYYGAVRGSIKDPTGAVIPNLKVALVDESTNVTHTTTTSSDGEYVFPDVIPSTYTIKVEATGFKKLERKGVIVDVQARIIVDLTLEVGSVTESVEVTGAAPLIQTANASQNQALTTQELADLPNIGRNPYIDSKLTPNIVQYGNPVMNRMQDQSSTANMAIAGSLGWVNNYIIDGVPTSDFAARPIIIPTIEAVQEVNVMTNTYDAEMGRTEGGMFNTTLKSGTNLLHGAVYGAIRRNSLDANAFFNNATTPVTPLSPIPNDDWAGNIGGPVVVPHLYNGRNKTFWFFAMEGYNNGAENSATFYVPTALERVGDFSKTVSQSGAPIIIYDPLSTVPNPGGGYTRTTFLAETGKNAIPTLNPVGKNIASYYGFPMTTPTYYGQPDVTLSTTSMSKGREYVGKIDENIRDWWHVSLSYMHCFTSEPGANFFGGPAASDDWTLWRKEDLTTINSLFTLSPTTVLAVRYGFNRFPNLFYVNSELSGFNPATLGFPTSYVNQMQGLQFPHIYLTTVLAGDSLSNSNSSYYNLYSNNLSAMLSKSRARHSLKVGFDFRRFVVTGLGYSDEAGSFSFNGVFSQSSPVSPLANTGADLADLLLGYPSTGDTTRSVGLTDFTHYYAIFGQDDFRVNSRLTLNLGLRWEREPGFQEVQNRLYTNFDKNALNPAAAFLNAGNNPNGIVPRGLIQWAGQGGAPVNVANPELNKFGPRLGVAYRIDSKTVIRGGFGLLWGPVTSIGGTYSPAGFSATTPYIASLNGNATPANSLSNPFPGNLLQPVGLSAGSLTAIGQGISVWSPTAKAPRVEQYSVDIQRELPGGIAFTLGYVGTRGTHLPMDLPENQLNPIYFSMGHAALNTSVANPFYGTPAAAGVIGTSTVPAYQLLLPFVTYGGVTFSSNSINKSLYNSLVVKAQKRISYGLTFLTQLTWEKETDYNGNQQNPYYNLPGEFSLSTNSVPVLYSVGFTYELPAGKGRRFINNNAALDYILGGWSFNGTGVYRSGFPLAMGQSNNYNGSLRIRATAERYGHFTPDRRQSRISSN